MLHTPSTHSITLEELIKGRAKIISELMKSEFGIDVSHGQCLKIVSQLFGFKNWNAAKALLPKEILLDPIEMAKFIRMRDEALAKRDAGSDQAAESYELRVSPQIKNDSSVVALKTVGDVRRSLASYNDSDLVDANYAFKLGDLLREIDELSNPNDEIQQEFSLHFRDSDHELAGKKFISLELKLDNETLSPANF